MTIAADIMTLALREARDDVKARIRRKLGAGAVAKLSIRELTELGKRELALKHHLRAAESGEALCRSRFSCPNV